MKLLFKKHNLEISFRENWVEVLVIEDPQVYSEILQDLWQAYRNQEAQITLYESAKELKISKLVELIFNPFAVDCNDRKVITKLYAELNERVNDYEYEKLALLNKECVDFLDLVTAGVPYAIAFDLELDPIALFKNYNVHIDMDSTGLLESILNYMKVCKKVLGIQIFSFVNLKSFLTEEELACLYEAAFYEKIFLLLIEGISTTRVNCENVTILDEDHCVIHLN